jgi:hypothetical protein
MSSFVVLLADHVGHVAHGLGAFGVGDDGRAGWAAFIGAKLPA